MDKQCFDIAELIGKYLAGNLTDEERMRLEAWVGVSQERKEWFETISSVEYRHRKLKQLRDVDVENGWKKLEMDCLKRRRTIWARWMRYAALLLFPVLGVGLVYWHWKGELDVEKSDCVVIEAGSSKARLILANGESVALEEQEAGMLMERNGTKINLENEHVRYENVLNAEDDELVYNELLIPRGGEYSLTLADGTVVFLNAESRLRFPVKFGKGVREVELEGEGYFEVARDTSAAFVVNTSSMKIRVLGTTFNVSAYQDDSVARATLVEGKVEVENLESGEEIVLRPNEQVSMRGSDVRVENVDVSYAIAWKDGRLRFQEKPLYEIMKIVSRWYNVEVEYEDEEVKNYAFGCNFSRHAEIVDLLKVFEQTGTVTFAIEGKKIFVAKKK